MVRELPTGNWQASLKPEAAKLSQKVHTLMKSVDDTIATTN